MSERPLVRFDRVAKHFRVHHERPRSFQDLLIRGLPRRTTEEFWALRDVSFTAEPGASVGIIGPNGSGKSTILKLITRILRPTSGEITVRGRVSALLELGAGFHPELSGRDNVFLNASILGMRRRDVAARFDDIVGFAGLERFIDIPVKHYSSGMYARLGFAVAVHVEPDVLLVDEVLSVGDEAFQARCLEAIAHLHREGKTLLLVSHDVAAICEVCTRAIWLDAGQIRAEGPPRPIVARYLSAMRDAQVAPSDVQPRTAAAPGRWGSGEAEILDVTLLDGNGEPCRRARWDEPLLICMRYRALAPIERPVFGLGIAASGGVQVMGPNSLGSLSIARIQGEGTVLYAVDRLLLAPGDYRLSASIYDETRTHAYDYLDGWYDLAVDGALPEGEGPSLLRLPARWSHESGVALTPTLSQGERGKRVASPPPWERPAEPRVSGAGTGEGAPRHD